MPLQTLTPEIEEAIMDVINGIYACSLIPDEHKEKYIEYIEKNGIDQKFIEELSKIFQQEQENIETELTDKKELLKGLDEIVQTEQKKIDKPQAEILAGLADSLDRSEAELKANLKQYDSDFEAAVEEIKTAGEQSEQDAIRAQLGLTKPTDHE